MLFNVAVIHSSPRTALLTEAEGTCGRNRQDWWPVPEDPTGLPWTKPIGGSSWGGTLKEAGVIFWGVLESISPTTWIWRPSEILWWDCNQLDKRPKLPVAICP